MFWAVEYTRARCFFVTPSFQTHSCRPCWPFWSSSLCISTLLCIAPARLSLSSGRICFPSPAIPRSFSMWVTLYLYVFISFVRSCSQIKLNFRICAKVHVYWKRHICFSFRNASSRSATTRLDPTSLYFRACSHWRSAVWRRSLSWISPCTVTCGRWCRICSDSSRSGKYAAMPWRSSIVCHTKICSTVQFTVFLNYSKPRKDCWFLADDCSIQATWECIEVHEPAYADKSQVWCVDSMAWRE